MSDPTPQPAGNPAPTPPEPQPPVPSAATLTQEQFNTALAEEKRKWKQQQDDAAAKVKRDAEEQARIKAGEFEAVATTRQADLEKLQAEHTTASERLTALTEAMEKQIKARLKGLPEELRAMIPDSADVLTRYEMTVQAESAAQKLAVQRTPGTPPGPRGSGAQPAAGGADANKLIAEKRARVGGL